MSKNATQNVVNVGHSIMGTVKVIVSDYRNIFSRKRAQRPHKTRREPEFFNHRRTQMLAGPTELSRDHKGAGTVLATTQNDHSAC